MKHVSIGICVHNEEKTIGKLLDSILTQKLESICIDEIIVISSGSTDNTNDIVREYKKKDKRIKPVVQNKREGKTVADNIFLKMSKNDIVVLTSGDLVFREDTIQKLVEPFANPKIGMTSVNPLPVNNANTFMGFVSCMHWRLHNKLERHGETIAFRKKLVSQIPSDMAADEAYIEAVIQARGYKAVHVNNAIIYNKGPETIRDFIKQRRRHYAQHLYLKEKMGYKVSSMLSLKLVKFVLYEVFSNIEKLHYYLGYLLLEIIARILGFYDYYIKKDYHIIWNISETTKNLNS